MKKFPCLIVAVMMICPVLGKSWTNNFGMLIGRQGTGISFSRWIQVRDKFSVGGQIKWFDIKAPDEFIVYNYYTGQYENTNEQFLILFPIHGWLNYYPFEGEIDNSIRPFVSLRGGPLAAVNADELNHRFVNRWRRSETTWSFSANIGVGVEIMLPGWSSLSVLVGYDYFPMDGLVDKNSDYNGMTLEFSFYRNND